MIKGGQAFTKAKINLLDTCLNSQLLKYIQKEIHQPLPLSCGKVLQVPESVHQVAAAFLVSAHAAWQLLQAPPNCK